MDGDEGGEEGEEENVGGDKEGKQGNVGIGIGEREGEGEGEGTECMDGCSVCVPPFTGLRCS